MSRLAPVLVLLVVGVVVAGCASSRSVLYGGVSFGVTGKKTVVTDAAAARDGKRIRKHWLAEIARRRRESGLRFRNLSRPAFRSRLAAAAARDHFTVERLQFVHSGQVTPLVVLRTDRYVALARAIPSIASSLDPQHGPQDWQGWSFGALYLEAQDERGVPFVVVTNVIGSGTATGGQWARSDRLFPYAHG